VLARIAAGHGEKNGSLQLQQASVCDEGATKG